MKILSTGVVKAAQKKAKKSDLLPRESWILDQIGEDFVALNKNLNGGVEGDSIIRFRTPPSTAEREIWEAQGLSVIVDETCVVAQWKQLESINKAAKKEDGSTAEKPLSFLDRIRHCQDTALNFAVVGTAGVLLGSDYIV